MEIVAGDGTDEIVNAASDLVLPIQPPTSNGTVVIQYQPDGGNEQGWVLLELATPRPRRITSPTANPTLCTLAS